jgi:phage shock protein PspC (stress-responsive transcriptional regulator)
MKVLYFLAAMLMSCLGSYACPACEKQQPKFLKGITHGVGPDSRWDYIIVVVSLVLVLVTLFYSIKWLIRPNETMHWQIKNSIINEW